METVYKRGILKGDIEPAMEKGYYFCTDLNGNSTLIKGKSEAVKYLRNN